MVFFLRVEFRGHHTQFVTCTRVRVIELMPRRGLSQDEDGAPEIHLLGLNCLTARPLAPLRRELRGFSDVVQEPEDGAG